jgi:basic amino acid/polyamine antiporter, APA family
MPLVPLLPILSALVSLILMLGLPWATWERLILWMGIGIAFYFGYGHHNARRESESTTLMPVARDVSRASKT